MIEASTLHRPAAAVRTPAAFGFTFANGIAVATDAPQAVAPRRYSRQNILAARRDADQALTDAILRARGAASAS